MSEVLIINPPNNIEVHGSLVFLAGPIQGAPEWQGEAIKLFKERNFLESPIAIASPRRSDESWKYEFGVQVDWETKYLRRAAQNGVILFWHAKEAFHVCERDYSQTTRQELGEWQNMSRLFKIPLVVGVEPGFPGERYIRHRLAEEGHEHIPITSTLEETVEATLHLLTYLEE